MLHWAQAVLLAWQYWQLATLGHSKPHSLFSIRKNWLTQVWQVWLLLHARQFTVVQLSQGIVPSEVVPLAQAVQLLLANPKSSLQLVQEVAPAASHPLQLELQSVHWKVTVLVNWVLLQAVQVLLNRPKPVEQDMQLPVVALQVRQPVQVWQVL